MALTQYLFEDIEIRIAMQDLGDPMFVAVDVCQALQIKNVSQAIDAVASDEKGICLTDTLGGEQSLLCVNEAGLYRLIFRSRKPAAERFRRWIFHEVLPEIRRTGFYRLQSAKPIPRLSVIAFLREKYPGRSHPPRFLLHYGQLIRKMAYALGVRGVLLEDEQLGEALAWPVPFLTAVDSALTGPQRLSLSQRNSIKGIE